MCLCSSLVLQAQQTCFETNWKYLERLENLCSTLSNTKRHFNSSRFFSNSINHGKTIQRRKALEQKVTQTLSQKLHNHLIPFSISVNDYCNWALLGAPFHRQHFLSSLAFGACSTALTMVSNYFSCNML
jgi:hypothetical protein